tara:strand:- start:1143 stop:1346 length:204 start_codon:yes stop_codon:yes gene_type:complete
MAHSKSIALPLAQQEYNSNDEAVTRRIIEQAIQDLSIDISRLQKMQDVIISKSIKRHQFLLMGAKSV